MKKFLVRVGAIAAILTLAVGVALASGDTKWVYLSLGHTVATNSLNITDDGTGVSYSYTQTTDVNENSLSSVTFNSASFSGVSVDSGHSAAYGPFYVVDSKNATSYRYVDLYCYNIMAGSPSITLSQTVGAASGYAPYTEMYTYDDNCGSVGNSNIGKVVFVPQ